MHGLCFVAGILLVCYMELRGAWTWLECCNSECCGLLELYLDIAIQDAADFVVWSWLELHIQFLYFFTTSSFANVGLGFVIHIHFQSSNISMLRFLHFEIHWDLVLSFFHSLGISWNLLLELKSGFRIFCWVWISNWRVFEILILDELKKDKK